MKDVKTIINNLAGIAGTLMGIERQHSELSEIIDKKIEHLSEVIEFVKEQQAEIEQMKEKQPRVIDRALLRAYLGCAVWLERVAYEPFYVGIITTIHEPYAISIINAEETKEQLFLNFYGTTWRCWTSKPTIAQQNAEKWDGEQE